MISKAQINFIKTLQQRKVRQKESLFLVEGAKMLDELLTSDFEIDQLILTENAAEHYSILCPNVFKKIATEIVNENQLSTLSSLQNVSFGLAVVKIKNQILNPSILFEQAKESLILVLDQIQDPGNLGTIIRLADWFGITQIVGSSNTVDCFNTKTIQATMGSVFRTPVFYANLEELFNNNLEPISVFGATLNGTSIYNHPLSSAGFIVLGNESKGISPEVLKFVTQQIKIPSFGKAESLNVAIATGIICSEFKSRLH